MRPVNLIPPEARRGDRAPTRTGPLAYVLVGALAVALAAITAVVLTSNQISDREAEVASLEAREAAARQRAEALAPYAEFAALKEARVQTVDTLARSRFDWERVLRELALVIPPDIQLTNVTGTVSPDVAVSEGGDNSLRDSAAGPALEIAGCAPDHEGVAALAASLEDIDGVTRVGVNGSAASDPESESGGDAASLEGGTDISCASSGSVAQFEMIAAFDEVNVAAATPPTVEETPTPTSAEAESPEVADARAQEDQARDSTAKQTGDAGDAAENLIPGTIR